MKECKLAILANENKNDHINWINAFRNFNISDYDIIDLTASNWYEEITRQKYDYLLAKPPGLTAPYKQLYDERIFIIDNFLKISVYPTPLEIYIYENKRFLYQWLKANSLPHAATYIFYNKQEAIEFVNNYNLPLVAKYNIGASGSGVHILKTKSAQLAYIEKSFSTGAPKRWGPNLEKGGLLKRGFNYILHPQQIRKKLSVYNAVRTDIQKSFIILQEYVEHDFEWRIVAIGDSYFAHKKLKLGDKASGSLLKNYDNPPLHLFDFAKNIMNKYHFTSQAIDLFETKDNKLLINEMQCMFGQSDPYQMLVDGKPGRYRYINDNWVFEEGDFAKNECFDLRVEHVLSILKKER